MVNRAISFMAVLMSACFGGSIASASCLNFSGVFYSEYGDQSIQYTNTQHECEVLTQEELYLENEMKFEKKMIFDGHFRVVYSSDSMIIRERFYLDSLGIHSEEETKLPNGKLSSRAVTLRQLDSQGNIRELTRYFDEGGHETSQFHRLYEKTK